MRDATLAIHPPATPLCVLFTNFGMHATLTGPVSDAVRSDLSRRRQPGMIFLIGLLVVAALSIPTAAGFLHTDKVRIWQPWAEKVSPIFLNMVGLQVLGLIVGVCSEASPSQCALTPHGETIEIPDTRTRARL